MVEKKEPNRQLVIIENEGISLSLLRKRSNAQTFPGWLIAEIKKSSKEGNLEMAKSLEFIYNKHKQLTSDIVELKNWKGKSTFEIFIKPDGFEIITYKKEDQDSKPKEVRRNIPREEVNRVIWIINKLNKGGRIHTPEIAEEFYHEKWDNIFSNRFEHTELNAILRLLDYYQITHYRGGYTTILKPIKEIQEILPS